MEEEEETKEERECDKRMTCKKYRIEERRKERVE